MFAITVLLCYLYYVVDFFLAYAKRSVYKYKLISVISNYIYFTDISYRTLLALDNPSVEIVKQRLNGTLYLKQLNKHSVNVSKSKMTDCRFNKSKILMPLLQQLELPAPNTIVDLDNHTVILKNGDKQHYLGNNAVHYFDQEFYRDLMSKWYDKMKQSNTQFVFTTLTPELIEHTNKITALTNTDQVRYCLSGSEAVDVAIKDVKTSTGKNVIIRFKNAYHGHLSGISNDAYNQIYLNEMDDESLKFIRDYHYKIAGVIINPMQFFVGPNSLSPPGEKLTIGKRQIPRVSKQQYSEWLYKLNNVCKYCTEYLTPVAFIMDDIYFAFRTKELFSYKFFSTDEYHISPDIIILAKGIAGGLPLSVICGKHNFMNFYDKKYMLKVNKSVGTYSGWEGGIIASNLFLDTVVSKASEFDRINAKFSVFAENTNMEFIRNDIPIRLHNFTNTFTIDYLSNSLYNSLYVQFLMCEEIFFSNQSTGKFNLSDDWTEDELAVLTTKMINAAIKMKEYGFLQENTNKYWYLVFVQMFAFNFVKIQYDAIMRDKHIDIQVSHNHPFNKFAHFWSSILMIGICYPQMYNGHYSTASIWFLFSHIFRQSGHFFYERQNRDLELKKFGHKDGTKKISTLGVGLSCILYVYRGSIPLFSDLTNDTIALYFMMLTIIPHFAEICHKYGFVRGCHWIIKIITDPYTDILDFYSYAFIHPKYVMDIRK